MVTIVNILLIAAALTLTVVLLKKEVNLGLIMFLDSVFVILVARLPILKGVSFALSGAFSTDTLKLVLILFLIMMIENIMRNSGMTRTMVDSLKQLLGNNRIAAGLLPIMLGLLPSPGGARFSCPMVDEVAKENTSDSNKSFINYWFRHVWMDGFILYPGIILAATLLKLSVISLFLHLIPFMIVSTITGVFFGLTHVKKEEIIKTRPYKESLTDFIKAMLPVVILIVLYILLLNYTPYSLEIASGTIIVILIIIKKYSFRKIIKIAREAFPLKLVTIIIGVMGFKEVLLKSGVIDGLPDLMKSLGIPVAALYILLPFIGSFTSGITVSFVSLTFPILIPLGLGSNIWYVAIAYTAGYVGNMVTPLHLCAVMTADYFKTPLSSLLKKIAIAAVPLFVLIVAILFFMVR